MGRRWWSDPAARFSCSRPSPCPGCSVPEGELHRPGCAQDLEELRRRIRTALQVDQGFRHAVTVLVTLAVTPSLRWWPALEAEGVTLESFQEAVADVLGEFIHRETPEDLVAVVKAAQAHLERGARAPEVLGDLALTAYTHGAREG